MFYLEEVTKEGEEIKVKLLENGQGFSLEEAWRAKNERYPGQTNVVVTWHKNPPELTQEETLT